MGHSWVTLTAALLSPIFTYTSFQLSLLTLTDLRALLQALSSRKPLRLPKPSPHSWYPLPFSELLQSVSQVPPLSGPSSPDDRRWSPSLSGVSPLVKPPPEGRSWTLLPGLQRNSLGAPHYCLSLLIIFPCQFSVLTPQSQPSHVADLSSKLF